ncbi:MAG: adenosylcobinamide-phosphate synthase CbiB [Pseudomonadota bacterium]
MSGAAVLMLLAWAVELAFSWPNWLFKLVRHPVVWIGSLVSALEARLNPGSWGQGLRYGTGAFTTILTVALVSTIAAGLAAALPSTWLGVTIEAVIASSLIASRSLYDHVKAVATPLGKGDLETARNAVSMIVGRDPIQLDNAGIARASLESLAENASDGVIAPVFWGAIFGLPGIAAYKAINTLDSMIGHRSVRYRAFGGFAARLDDIANLIPARLTGLFIAIASLNGAAFKTMLHDASRHRSPNAGWPEAAMAGALGVRLSGPRQYEDHISEEPWLNEAGRDPGPQDLTAGLRLYILAMGIAALCLALAAGSRTL